MPDHDGYWLIEDERQATKDPLVKKLGKASAGFFLGFFSGVYVGYYKSYHTIQGPIRRWDQRHDGVDLAAFTGLVGQVIHIPSAILHGLYGMFRGASLGFNHNVYHAKDLFTVLSAPTNRFHSLKQRQDAEKYLHERYGLYPNHSSAAEDNILSKTLMHALGSESAQERTLVLDYFEESQVTNPYKETWSSIESRDFIQFVMKRCVNCLNLKPWELIEHHITQPDLKNQFFRVFIENLLCVFAEYNQSPSPDGRVLDENRKKIVNHNLKSYFQLMPVEMLSLFSQTLGHLKDKNCSEANVLFEIAQKRILTWETSLPQPIGDLIGDYTQVFSPSEQPESGQVFSNNLLGF